nr:hypothetical protein KK1_010337 [Ipomoea batatas]
MISGAKYSCVPTKEFDRASTGSTTSCGNDLLNAAASAFSFLALVVAGKILGLKHETLHDGPAQKGSMQLDPAQGPEILAGSNAQDDDFRRVGLTEHLSDRSKSEAHMQKQQLRAGFVARDVLLVDLRSLLLFAALDKGTLCNLPFRFSLGAALCTPLTEYRGTFSEELEVLSARTILALWYTEDSAVLKVDPTNPDSLTFAGGFQSLSAVLAWRDFPDGGTNFSSSLDSTISETRENEPITWQQTQHRNQRRLGLNRTTVHKACKQNTILG